MEIWEVFRMRAVFEKFQREEKKRERLLGAKVLKLIKNGHSVKAVSEETGLTEEEVKEIAELNK